MITKLRYWVVLAIAITGVCGLVYLAGQQNLRMSANDPQIQMSEDIAQGLAHGMPVQSFVSSVTRVDARASLAPFVVVYDKSGRVFMSGVQLDGVTPQLPDGVLSYAKQYGQNRLTWEPKDGVRIAAVVTAYNGTNSGYVLAGRSLREVEIREDRLALQVSLGWIIILIVTFIASLMFIKAENTPEPVRKSRKK